MKYKEEVLKIYPNARIFEDTNEHTDIDLKYCIVNIKYKRKIIRQDYGYFQNCEFYKYKISYWMKSPKDCWEHAYSEIVDTFLKNLNE
jgi:hypothetical protein